MNKYLTLIIMLFCISYNAIANAKDIETEEKPAPHSVDSTQILLSKKTVAKAKIIIPKDGCKTTKEVVYSTSLFFPHDANPYCPENSVVNKVHFRTTHKGLDINTYVSFECCKQETSWNEKA